jgi:hypothetical protein
MTRIRSTAAVGDGPNRAHARALCAVGILAVAVAGCGSDKPPRPQVATDTAHHAAVEKDPYRLTCDDLERQPLNSTNQRLVIHAEFALAQDPALSERVEKMTSNRVGRSVYWALTDVCKDRPADFEPGRQAVDAVRDGKYLVQPRPESWSRPERWSKPSED